MNNCQEFGCVKGEWGEPDDSGNRAIRCRRCGRVLTVTGGKVDTVEEQLNAANFALLEIYKNNDGLVSVESKIKNYFDRWGVKHD